MADLATEIGNAIIMLSNYARHDEQTGQFEDAEFTRAAVRRLIAAVEADAQNYSKWRWTDEAKHHNVAVL